jgi:hypothetical protein
VLCEAEVKKLAEDERRANIVAIREEKAKQRAEEKLRKEEEKEAAAASKKKKGESASSSNKKVEVEGDATSPVLDARWAKSLKPNDLKQELKNRSLSTQGAKKELLARLIADLQEKL